MSKTTNKFAPEVRDRAVWARWRSQRSRSRGNPSARGVLPVRALRFARRRPPPWSSVGSGRALARHKLRRKPFTALTSERPGLPIILATDYGELPTSPAFRVIKLGMPFTEKELARAVEQALAEA